MRVAQALSPTSKSWRLNLAAVSLIAALMSILLWGGIYARIADQSLRMDKDLLYLYLCGVEIGKPASHEQQDELINQLAAASASEHLIYRAKVRGSYCNNYWFTSISTYLIGKLQVHFGFVDPIKDFPEFLLISLRWGIGLSGAIIGVLCLIVAFGAARGALVFATLGAIVIAALLYLVLPAPNLSWMLYQATPAPPARIVNLPNIFGLSFYSWLNPSAVFSPFSIYPRCLCAMLAFAAFTLRWSGRYGSAYWVPLVLSLVHQSEAPILLTVMIVCDLVLRPSSLIRLSRIVPIAIVVIVVMARERMLSLLGLPWLPILLFTVLIGVAVAIFMLPRGRATARTVWRFAADWQARLRGLSTPVSETIVILTMWLVILLISYAFKHDTQFRVIYLWSELPSRYVGLFQLTVIAGVTYPVWTAFLAKRLNADKAALVAISGLALLLAIGEWRGPWNSTAGLVEDTRRYEEIVAKGYEGETGSYARMENPWYYLMLRRAFTGGKGIADYFAKG